MKIAGQLYAYGRIGQGHNFL